MKHKFLFWELDNENNKDRSIVFMILMASILTILLLVKMIFIGWGFL